MTSKGMRFYKPVPVRNNPRYHRKTNRLYAGIVSELRALVWSFGDREFTAPEVAAHVPRLSPEQVRTNLNGTLRRSGDVKVVRCDRKQSVRFAVYVRAEQFKDARRAG